MPSLFFKTNAVRRTMGQNELYCMLMSEHEGEKAGSERLGKSRESVIPLRPAKGWLNAPEGAKEFYIPVSYGKERRTYNCQIGTIRSWRPR